VVLARPKPADGALMLPEGLAAAIAADRDRALALTPVSRETAERLDALVEVLLDWQGRMNLVAASTLPQVWTRHIADSLQLLPLAPDAKTWIDLGSGAGFPGLVIACARADDPGTAVHLVESTRKKARFLAEAAQALHLPVTVHDVRIEDFTRGSPPRADVVTARAVAPLPQLISYAAPLLRAGAKGLFMKGQDVEAELTSARKEWTLEVESVPSVTDSRARILIVREARRLAG
jgi:16S rRNA (guanine527-N7)-methyltransferase